MRQRHISAYWQKRAIRKRNQEDFNDLIRRYVKWHYLTPEEKEQKRKENFLYRFYKKELIESVKPILVSSSEIPFDLPLNCGKTVQWRKWNPLPDGGYTTYIAEIGGEEE